MHSPRTLGNFAVDQQFQPVLRRDRGEYPLDVGVKELGREMEYPLLFVCRLVGHVDVEEDLPGGPHRRVHALPQRLPPADVEHTLVVLS